MAGPNFPSLSELANAEFMGFPAYQQAQQQIGLANQFAQQGLQSGAADLTAKNLANLFSEQYNPLRIEAAQLQNQGLGFDNLNKGVSTRKALRLEEPDYQATLAKLDASTADSVLKLMDTTAQQMMFSEDPATRERGNQMWQRSQEYQEKRLAEKAKTEQARLVSDGRIQMEGMRQDGANERAKAAAEAKIEAARVKSAQSSDIYTNMIAGKVPPDRAAMAFGAAAMQETDPELRKKYLAAAEIADKMAQRLKANQGGKVDMSEYVKTNPFQSEASNLPSTGPVGATAPAAAAPAAATPPVLQTPTRVAPATQGERDKDARYILTTEREAQAERVRMARTPEDRRREELDLAGIDREIARLPGGGGSRPAGQTAKPPSPAVGVPKTGEVRGGYRFKGGNPADKNNWEKV